MKITSKDGFILIDVKVIPKSSKNTVEFFDNGLKVKLKAPPVDGKANKELIDFMSKTLGISKSCVHIERGETSKTKTLKIEITEAEFIKIIGGKCG